MAGPAAARVLADAERGRVELVLGTGAAYLRFGRDGWLLVSGPRAPLGPLSLLVDRIDELAGSVPGAAARVDGAALIVGDARVALSGLRVAPPVDCPPLAYAASVDAALRAALASVPPPPAALAPGIAALEAGDPHAAVALLAGRGDGLTPAGDDVLAGYAGWQYSVGSPSALTHVATGRAAPIGLAYLRCAERGELPQPAAALLAAIRSGDAPTARRRARALGGWGSTSGAALLWGMAAAYFRLPIPSEPSADAAPASPGGSSRKSPLGTKNRLPVTAVEKSSRRS